MQSLTLPQSARRTQGETGDCKAANAFLGLGELLSYQLVHGNQKCWEPNACARPGPLGASGPLQHFSVSWGHIKVSTAGPVSPESEPRKGMNPAEIPVTPHTHSDVHLHTSAPVHTRIHSLTRSHTHTHSHSHTRTRTHTLTHFLTGMLYMNIFQSSLLSNLKPQL